MSDDLSRFDLDRFVAGELTEAEAHAMEERIAGSADAQQYVAARREEQEALLDRLPPSVFAARVKDGARHELQAEMFAARRDFVKSRTLRWGVGFAAAALAVVIALLVLPRGTSHDGSLAPALPEPDSVRWMGEGALVHLVVLRDDAVLTDETPRVGDRIRYEITLPPNRRGYAAVVAVVEGHASVVLPEGAEAQEIVETGFLPGSVALSPGGGRASLLVFVRGEPFEVETLRREVDESIRTDRWPPGMVRELDVDLGP